MTRRKVHRAFPELDGYDDAHCRRFVLAAVGPWRYRAAIAISMGTVLVVGAFLSIGLGASVGEFVFHLSGRKIEPDPVWAAVSGLGIGVAGILMFWTRDVILLLRVRFLLRTRGRCSCGYSLLGLSIDPGLHVTCPECGSRTRVDAALGELVLDEQGQARYRAGERTIPHRVQAYDPGRTRWRWRLIRRLSASLLLMLLLTLFSYWGVLIAQAKDASAARPTQADYMGLYPSISANSPGGPNAWECSGPIAERIFGRLQSHVVSDGGWNTFVDYMMTLGGYRVSSLPGGTGAPGFKPSPDVARALIDEMDRLDAEHEWTNLSDALALPNRFPPLVPQPPAGRAVSSKLQSHLRNAAYFLLGRANLARTRHNPRRFAQAMADLYSLAQIQSTDPFYGEIYAGMTSDFASGSILDLLSTDDSEWVTALYPVVKNARQLPPMIEQVRALRLQVQDELCWLFEDPSRVCLERWSSGPQEMFGTLRWPIRLGFYWESQRLISGYFDQVETALAQGQQMRAALGFGPPRTTLAVADLLGRLGLFAEAPANTRLFHDGAITTVCIERYKLDHGEYPPSLQALVDAGMLSGVPKDPYSGGPLVYERGGPKAAAHGVGYVLYSVGPDGNDDGLAAPDCLPARPAGTKPGHDYSFPILDQRAGP